MSNLKKYPGQIGDTYKGKVRNVSEIELLGGGIILVSETTNNISAFDVVLPPKIPFKGVVLNLMASYFMQETADIIPNCLIEVIHPRVSIWKKAKPFKFEVIVRGFNAEKSSFYRNYVASNKPNPWGYNLPWALRKNEKFPFLLVTPTTKAEKGHDEDISSEEIIGRGLATKEEWNYIEKKAKELFERGQEIACKNNLILVDTKYEFGKDKNGEIILIDEVHTPDSSRYWYLSTYEEYLENGEEPKALSKEFVRQWLIERGFQGREGDVIPEFPDEFVNEITYRYLELYKKMGLRVSNLPSEDTDPREDIVRYIEKMDCVE